MKALLIGCGNIGALYDLNDDSKVWTHAKAYAMHPEIELTITDEDASKAKPVAERYRAGLLSELNDDDFKQFQIVSITTPTPTHFSFLEKALRAKVPVVICEKPVTASLSEVQQLKKLYEASSSKVLVNYIRRFQPAYAVVKQKVGAYLKDDAFKGVIVKYKRGFLNNASHAIDLLAYLFEQPFEFKNFQVQSASYDAFDYDPTLTATCMYADQPAVFLGLEDINYPVFELEIFFGKKKIVCCHSGNDIRYYEDKGRGLEENKDERQENVLAQYMLPVIEEAVDLFQKRKSMDNFIPALRTNEEILNILKTIKK